MDVTKFGSHTFSSYRVITNDPWISVTQAKIDGSHNRTTQGTETKLYNIHIPYLNMDDTKFGSCLLYTSDAADEA